MSPTPAPWTVTVLDQAVFIHGGPDNDEIADFSFADEHTVSISKEEAIANATLCAAAHDLLEALAALVETFRSRPDMLQLCGFRENAQINAACAALNKATTVTP